MHANDEPIPVPVEYVPAEHWTQAPEVLMPEPVEYVPAEQASGKTVVYESPRKLNTLKTSVADRTWLYILTSSI